MEIIRSTKKYVDVRFEKCDVGKISHEYSPNLKDEETLEIFDKNLAKLIDLHLLGYTFEDLRNIREILVNLRNAVDAIASKIMK